MGGKTYFIADDGSTGDELWVTDGTDAGTHIVKDINEGSLDAVADNWTECAVMNGRLYFVADDGTTGDELWATDGTESGTVRVKDINLVETAVGSGITRDGAPYELTVMNGLLYFSANDGVNGSELWVSDGTADGTTRLTDINTSGNSSPGFFTPIGNKLYFRAYDGGTVGCALWVYDAELETDPVSLVKDPNSTDSAVNWSVIGGINVNGGIIAMNGLLYFVGEDVAGNSELWVSNGTGPGTEIVAEIGSGTTGSSLGDLTAIDEIIYFAADNGATGKELWISDGTDAGTEGIDIADDPTTDSSYPQYFTEFNGLVYFNAQGDSSGEEELWVTDGTAEGTKQVKVIEPDGGSNPEQLTVLNGKLVFQAYNDDTGVELWVTDGTEDGTKILKDINEGSGDSNPSFE